jgi:Flp pilus assembly protein protease CpaA
MQFEELRIFIAVGGLLAASYYDLFNRRNVPGWVTYLMLGAGILLSIATLDFASMFYPGIAAAAILGFGYFIYKSGQIGGADVLIFAALALLLPSAPVPLLSLRHAVPLLTLPFILSIFVLSGLLSIIGMSTTYVPRIITGLPKGKVKVSATSLFSAAVIVASYGVVMYFVQGAFPLPLIQVVAIAILVLLAAVLILFKEYISDSMIEWVPISRIDDEDVIALEKLDPALVRKYSLGKVLTPAELSKLRKTKLKKFPIFKGMPPFVPYMLLALILLLLFGDIIPLIFS